MKSYKRNESRKIISATIDNRYIIWLKQIAESYDMPQSRLLEKGLQLLKEQIEKEEKREMEEAINAGIDAMLKEGEDQTKIAESQFDPRIGAELL